MSERDLFSCDVGDDFVDPERETVADEEDTVSADFIVEKKVVRYKDIDIVMELRFTKQPDQDDGVTLLRVYESGKDEEGFHLCIESLDPYVLVNGIEQYLVRGRRHEVAEFVCSEGNTAHNPVFFRMKLEGYLGSP